SSKRIHISICISQPGLSPAASNRSPLNCHHVNTSKFKRDLSTVFCQTRARSGRNRRFVWIVPRFGRIRMQAIGFAGMAAGMLVLLAAVGLTNSIFHIPLVFTGFILFNLLMNAGPNSTTFTLAPILFPTQLRARAGGFAASVAKLGATVGVFLLPILKERFGVPSVLGIVSAVSLLGLVVTLALRREDNEQRIFRIVEMALESDTFHPRRLWK